MDHAPNEQRSSKWPRWRWSTARRQRVPEVISRDGRWPELTGGVLMLIEVSGSPIAWPCCCCCCCPPSFPAASRSTGTGPSVSALTLRWSVTICRHSFHSNFLPIACLPVGSRPWSVGWGGRRGVGVGVGRWRSLFPPPPPQLHPNRPPPPPTWCACQHLSWAALVTGLGLKVERCRWKGGPLDS